MIPDQTVLTAHKQIYSLSCVPMSVELVLKLLHKLPLNDFPLQLMLGPNNTGAFTEFDSRTRFGVRFKQEFAEHQSPDFLRGPAFPLDALFNRMREEIAANRYVIVSLESGCKQYHMHVVHAYNPSTDDFDAVTEYYLGQASRISDVKRQILKMKGTDILTYSL
jgi:hypothetical protein